MPATRRTTVFAKRPAPAEVKTRLVPPLTFEQAAELAECMLLDVIDRLARWSVEDGLALAVCHAPADARGWFAERMPSGVALAPQVGEGLGARLAAHFEEEARLAPRATHVVCGADAPLLARDTVLAAHRALEEGHDLALSPDLGGGYALVGLRAPRSELFTQVPMSGAGMLALTLELAARRSLSVCMLPPTLDVDVAADLERLARALGELPSEHPDRPARTERWLAVAWRSME